MVKRNIMFSKAGGTAGANSVGYKLNIPADMIKALGVTAEDRSVDLTFEENKIVIKKSYEGGLKNEN